MSVEVFLCTAIENEPIQGFSVVPNPNAGQFQVNVILSNPAVCNLTIHDIQGKAVYSEALNLNAQMHALPLDLQNVSDGIYFLHLEADNQRFVQKLIVQRK